MAHAITIGQAAKATGMAAKTIRFYEEVGVLPAPTRTAAGYRQYTDEGVQQLLFVGRARGLGSRAAGRRGRSASCSTRTPGFSSPCCSYGQTGTPRTRRQAPRRRSTYSRMRTCGCSQGPAS